MEHSYVEILGIYPGMFASKFSVRQDTWDHYCEDYMNERAGGACFMPCKDAEGEALFVDMTKLLAFYVLKKQPVKKTKKKKAVSEK
jgi:hypothetical protein